MIAVFITNMRGALFLVNMNLGDSAKILSNIAFLEVEILLPVSFLMEGAQIFSITFVLGVEILLGAFFTGDLRIIVMRIF